MSIQKPMQEAGMFLMGKRPATFFGSSQQFELEISTLINEAAEDIASEIDWQSLTRIASFTGDGSQVAFDLPEDFNRMLVGSELQNPDSWFWRYKRAVSVDEFIQAQGTAGQGFHLGHPGIWVMMDNQIHVYPAPPAGARAMFPYITSHIGKSAMGQPKASFTSDDDEFAIRGGERLLKLWLIWRWRENKKYDATGDQENYEKALGEVAGRDGGARVIRRNSGRLRGNLSVAWPWELG